MNLMKKYVLGESNHIIQERLLWIFTNIYVCGNYNNLVLFSAKHAIPFSAIGSYETSHLISEYTNIGTVYTDIGGAAGVAKSAYIGVC